MKTHRKIIPIVALALGAQGLAAASAPATPLLSGYGGPGQGTQAILGSTLLNGPSSGAGGSTGSAAATATPAGGLATPGGRSGGSSSGKGRGSGARGNRSGAAGASGAGTHLSLSPLARASAGGSGVLGLSDAAFLVVLLSLAALFFTGLLTRGLAKASWARWHAGS